VTDTENEPLDEPMDPGLAEAEVDPEDPKQIELEEAIATARGAASDAKDFVAGLKAVDDALARRARTRAVRGRDRTQRGQAQRARTNNRGDARRAQAKLGRAHATRRCGRAR